MLLTVIKYTSPRRIEFVCKEILKRLRLEQASPLSCVDPYRTTRWHSVAYFYTTSFQEKQRSFDLSLLSILFTKTNLAV